MGYMKHMDVCILPRHGLGNEGALQVPVRRGGRWPGLHGEMTVWVNYSPGLDGSLRSGSVSYIRALRSERETACVIDSRARELDSHGSQLRGK